MTAVDRCRRVGWQSWLRVGAASAGASALLLGVSLTGPQLGVAAVETSDESSVSSVSAGPAEAGSEAEPTTGTAGSTEESQELDTRDEAAAEPGIEDTDEIGDAEGQGEGEGDLEDAAVELEVEDSATTEAEEPEETGSTAAAGETDATLSPNRADMLKSASDVADIPSVQSVADVALPQRDPAMQWSSEVALVAAPEPDLVHMTVVAERSRPQLALALFDPEVRRLAVAERIEDFMSAAQAYIAALPVDPGFRDWLSGVLLLVRRTFLNQAPVVAPVQISGRVSGPIEGDLGAVDLEGDRVIYRLTQAPKSGSVQISEDGKYTYTPGSDFAGADSFSVAARDAGLHFNVLDPFRGVDTDADVLVNQGAIKFEFSYGTGSQYWSAEAREALHDSANALAAYFMVKTPVTITYDIKGINTPDSDTLASAFSALTSSDAGYFPTVVQNKLLTGVDSNGSKADGEIEVNWAKSWALGETVGADEYDFTSTIMHEAMHSFGFFSDVSQPGENTDENWPVFARFVVTSRGAKPIGKDFEWNTQYDKNLTGGNGGLYFGGKNAVRAYKKRVPLYTPNPWEKGSSMSHLDDSTFVAPNEQMMNAKTETGLGIRVLSSIELGIMKDLGYTIGYSGGSPTSAAFFIFVIFLRRTRRAASVA